MAWRIEEHVIRGEIDNRTRGRVTGRIWFAGLDQPVTIDLTGNAWHDVAGRHIKFINPDPKPGLPECFSLMQRGTAGDITASRKVRVPDISLDQIGEYYEAKKPFPWHWGNSLYFEWFGERNGRVVIESASFQLTISTEPTWRMSPEEEREQHKANNHAFESFMDQTAGARDAFKKAELADTGSEAPRPQTEAEAEKMFADSERLADRVAARLEREGETADFETIIQEEVERARQERGEPDPTPQQLAEQDRRIEEMNAAAEEALVEREAEKWNETEDGNDSDEDHPLAKRSFEFGLHVSDTITERGWAPVEASPEHPTVMLVNSLFSASAKLAGALNGEDWPPSLDFCASIIVRLKRAAGYLSDAQLAADSCREDNLVDGKWLQVVSAEITSIAAETDAILAELRARLQNRS